MRRREIGTRIALGATPRDILGMIVRESLRPVVWGTMLGIVSAWAFTRVLRSLLFGVAPTDLGTFAAVVSILLGVTVAACLIPSIRAVRSDPVAALRHE